MAAVLIFGANKKLAILIYSLLFLFAFSFDFTRAKGTFQSYNNEARQKYKELQIQHLNEIDGYSSQEEKEYFNAQISNVSNFVKTNSGNSLDKFKPDWNSLDSRPLPEWYDQSKVGIFIHWGVFSVPGIADAWFWNCWKVGRKDCVDFIKENYKPDFTYQEFAPEFTAEFYDPNQWAELFEKSGAKYIVLTSKHHEGFTLWPSKYSFSWNSMDVGPKRDLVGELANAVRNKTSLHFGLYHSLLEWYNPLYINDQKNNLSTQEFVNFKTMPELYEIVNTYKPEIVWSDGEWERPDTYWNSVDFLAWLYNESPVKDIVVTNDRWGSQTMCKHGGFFTCNDKYNPGVLQPRKWENCFTLDKYSWGIRINAKIEDYLTPEELIKTIIESVSCGGNVLVNVGPTKDGVIVPIQQERLLQMGEWLSINGDAIYNSVPWKFQNDTVTTGVWYTTNKSNSIVYAMMTNWPGNEIRLGAVSDVPGMKISMLGAKGELKYIVDKNPGILITLPTRENVLTKWAWTLTICVP